MPPKPKASGAPKAVFAVQLPEGGFPIIYDTPGRALDEVYRRAKVYKQDRIRLPERKEALQVIQRGGIVVGQILSSEGYVMGHFGRVTRLYVNDSTRGAEGVAA